MSGNRIQQIEDYVRQTTSGQNPHDFLHIDRVRKWALQIAKSEGFDRLELVHAAALLHDLGRARGEEKRHAQIGAEMAARFLTENNLFTPSETQEIANAVRHHNSLDRNGRLAEILMDADILDLLGAVGIMRAFTSKHAKPEYDPDDVKGETWGLPNHAFNTRFASGIGIGQYIVDQINFQTSCYDNLHTPTARRIARPMVEFMRTYLVQLQSEIKAGESGPVE